MFYTKIVMMNGCSHELQAQAGETVTSAYAVDSETMRKLYKFNMSFFQKKGGALSDDIGDDYIGWGGPCVQLMLQTL